MLAANADDGQPAPDFDVHLLGMGGEGHINSLFPHTPAVRETTRLVVGVTDSPKPPPRRITLTLPAVQRSREVWLVVSGEAKADAVAAAIGGASPEDVPAAGAVGRAGDGVAARRGRRFQALVGDASSVVSIVGEGFGVAGGIVSDALGHVCVGRRPCVVTASTRLHTDQTPTPPRRFPALWSNGRHGR